MYEGKATTATFDLHATCNNKSKQTRQYFLRTANNHVLGIYPQNQNLNSFEVDMFSRKD